MEPEDTLPMHPLSLLLGAALVILGVLAPAVADRIRGSSRRERDTGRSAERSAAKLDAAANKLEPAKFVPGLELVNAQDVIAALVGAGFKKAAASEAAMACTPSERKTLEGWTEAALRRCAKGVAS